MRKKILKTAKGRILAATVLIAGICGIAAAAWATTCFLPAGNCSTGKVDYNGDGNGGGDDKTPDTTEDKCKDFDNNTSKSDYEWKSKTSCFKCTTCTSNSTTQYNCENNSGYAWDSSDGGHCCISGEKWYSSAGACCSTTNGCTCTTLQKWDTAKGKCVCQYAETSDGTCCEQGKIADGSLCCNSGEHAEKTRCCPALMVEDSNGTCTCADGYIPDSTGTGCTKKPNDDGNITVKFQYTCNGGSCSSDVTDKIKYEFNGSEIGNNISGTAIAKTDWTDDSIFSWQLTEELVDRSNLYSCSYDGVECGHYTLEKGYDNDACKEGSTYELQYHDFDFVSDTDVISSNTVATVEIYPLKDDSTGKYFYIIYNEYDALNNKCGALATHGKNFDYAAYDSCMLKNAHEVANNEIVLQIPLKGGEQCAALNGQKCIYYVVNCPFDEADCMDYAPRYTIAKSGDSSRVTGGYHSMQLMSDDDLLAKFNETKIYGLEPESNKLVYYSCDLQEWDEVTLEVGTRVIGYAFDLNNQCSTIRFKTKTYEAGPGADQVGGDKLIGYIKILGSSSISGTTVTSQLSVAGIVNDEFTIGGSGQAGFSVYYNCGNQTSDSHDAHMYSKNTTTIRAGKYNRGWTTVFTQTGSAADCSANYGEASVGRTYFSLDPYGTNEPSTRCKDRLGMKYFQDSKGTYIILCGAKYDGMCDTAD